MTPAGFRSLLDTINEILHPETVLDELVVSNPGVNEAYLVTEGRWIKTKSANSIRVDQATHGVGQTHAHIYGRKGSEIGVVNLDGSASHGTRMKLSKKDAATLKAQGFNVRADRVVEWIIQNDCTWEFPAG